MKSQFDFNNKDDDDLYAWTCIFLRGFMAAMVLKLI